MPTAVRPGFNTQVVVAVMLVLPGFAAPPAARLKLTALAESATVSDSDMVALSEICGAFDGNCANDIVESDAIASRSTAIRKEADFMFPPRFSFRCLYSCCSFSVQSPQRSLLLHGLFRE